MKPGGRPRFGTGRAVSPANASASRLGGVNGPCGALKPTTSDERLVLRPLRLEEPDRRSPPERSSVHSSAFSGFPFTRKLAPEVRPLAGEAGVPVEPGPRPAACPCATCRRSRSSSPRRGGSRRAWRASRRSGVRLFQMPLAWLYRPVRKQARLGRAERVDDERVAEPDALGGEAVHVRRLEPREAALVALLLLHDAHGVVPLVVGEQEDEVRPVGRPGDGAETRRAATSASRMRVTASPSASRSGRRKRRESLALAPPTSC